MPRVLALALATALTGCAAERPPPETETSPAEFRGLFAWTGLVPGDGLLYRTGGGVEHCARIDRPRRIGDREWVALQGLPWPGLASDSVVLLSTEGPPELGVIRTPGPRPTVEPLYPDEPHPLRWIPADPDAEAVPVALVDGWTAIGGTRDDPVVLVRLWCAGCADARSVVRLRKGEGIVGVEAMTIRGEERIALAEDGCDPPGVEVEFRVEPTPPRDP